MGAGQDQQAVSDKIRVVISVLQTTGEPARSTPATGEQEKNNKQKKKKRKKKTT